jgi:hypothetical protein
VRTPLGLEGARCPIREVQGKIETPGPRVEVVIDSGAGRHLAARVCLPSRFDRFRLQPARQEATRVHDASHDGTRKHAPKARLQVLPGDRSALARVLGTP